MMTRQQAADLIHEEMCVEQYGCEKCIGEWCEYFVALGALVGAEERQKIVPEIDPWCVFGKENV